MQSGTAGGACCFVPLRGIDYTAAAWGSPARFVRAVRISTGRPKLAGTVPPQCPLTWS